MCENSLVKKDLLQDYRKWCLYVSQAHGFWCLGVGFSCCWSVESCGSFGLECCDLIALKKNQLLMHITTENLIQKSKGLNTEDGGEERGVHSQIH